jgi:hypothetical protein
MNDVDSVNFARMEKADRMGFERPPRLFVAFHLRQSADPVALQTRMERRAPQMRDGRLQGVEAVVKRPAWYAFGKRRPLPLLPRSGPSIWVVGPVGRSVTEVRTFHLATVF